MSDIDQDVLITWDETFERECGYLPDGSPVVTRREADQRDRERMRALLMAQTNLSPADQRRMTEQYNQAAYCSLLGIDMRQLLG